MDKEYLMLRSEIEESLKKQSQLFNVIVSILGFTNLFSRTSENITFLFLILFLSTLLQLRILEYRNTVYYVSTYMVVFLEIDSDFHWETRLRQFKKEGYSYKNVKFKKKILNTLVINLGRVLKHLAVLGLAMFIFFRILLCIYYSSHVLWIKIVLYVTACLLMIFNILYAYALSTDKNRYDSYLAKWESIRIKEQEKSINS